MQQIEVDVTVIGAGTAGMLAYRGAVNEGKRVLLVESGAYGTMCARVGCMPSKLLIAAAERAHMAQHSQAFGVRCEQVEIDGVAVMARVKAERDRFVSFAVADVAAMPAEDKIQGHARFLDPERLQVGEETIVRSQAWVIATGSTPIIPGPLKNLGSHLVVNDDVFSWDSLPASVIVVGTGVIALELGQALQRLGVNVVLVGRSQRIGPLADPQMAAEAQAVFAAQLEFCLDADIVSAEVENGLANLRLSTPQGERVLEANYVLAATGRSPNVQGLGLENTGLTLSQRGLPTFDPETMQCQDSNIFIAGDANGVTALQHVAADDGRIAGRNAARFPNLAPGQRRSALALVFSDPQMAMVGERYQVLKDGTFVTGTASFANQGRSRIMGVNQGRLNLYAEIGSGRLLGAEMLGPAAEHLGHLLAWAHQQGLTVQEMLNMPYYHPVIEEALRSALGDCRKALLQAQPLGAEPGTRLA